MNIGDLAQILTPIGVLVTAWVSWDNKRILRKQNQEQARQSENIQKIEIATNSMKDQLVAATAVAAELVGRAKGVTEGIKQEQDNPTVGRQP